MHTMTTRVAFLLLVLLAGSVHGFHLRDGLSTSSFSSVNGAGGRSKALVNLRAHGGSRQELPEDMSSSSSDGHTPATHPDHPDAVAAPLPDAPEEVGPTQEDHIGEEADIIEETLHETHADRKMPVPVYALMLGLVSGVSMPVGAFLGYQLAPVRDTVCAAMMAFGAGALLFAVTVELYGHALHEVRKGRMGILEMNCTMICAVGGAIFYLYVNRWLEEKLGGHADEEDVEEAGQKKVERQVSSASAAKPVDGTDKVGRRGNLAQLAAVSELEKEKKSLVAKNRWKKIRQAVKKTSVISMISSSKKSSADESTLHTEEDVETPPMSARKSNSSQTAHGRTFAVAFAKAFTKVPLSDEDRQREEDLEKRRKEEAEKAKKVAYGLFLGLLIDGIPEGVLMGFLAAEGHLTPVFIVSLFVANFPEAFCSASLLKTAEMGLGSVVGMWLGLCLLVGSLCGFSCWLLFFYFPNFGAHHDGLPFEWRLIIAGVEGLTGGAMIACISSVMLPEAFTLAKKGNHILSSSGFWCVLGFLLSVYLKANGG